jgi:hypothetical protein
MLSVVFTADGKSLVTGSGDGTLRVWEPASGRLVVAWQEHRKAVRQVARLKGDTFVSAGDDGAVVAWNTAGKPLIRYRAD